MITNFDFETCSGKRHFFNTMFEGETWDRKCDCGKKKMSKKQYKELLDKLGNKIEALVEVE